MNPNPEFEWLAPPTSSDQRVQESHRCQTNASWCTIKQRTHHTTDRASDDTVAAVMRPDFCCLFAICWVSVYIFTIIYFWVVIGYRSHIQMHVEMPCVGEDCWWEARGGGGSTGVGVMRKRNRVETEMCGALFVDRSNVRWRQSGKNVFQDGIQCGERKRWITEGWKGRQEEDEGRGACGVMWRSVTASGSYVGGSRCVGNVFGCEDSQFWYPRLVGGTG